MASQARIDANRTMLEQLWAETEAGNACAKLNAVKGRRGRQPRLAQETPPSTSGSSTSTPATTSMRAQRPRPPRSPGRLTGSRRGAETARRALRPPSSTQGLRTQQKRSASWQAGCCNNTGPKITKPGQPWETTTRPPTSLGWKQRRGMPLSCWIAGRACALLHRAAQARPAIQQPAASLGVVFQPSEVGGRVVFPGLPRAW